MGLRDPVAVYNAASNVEALLVRDALIAAGIEAHVTEDLSPVGTWVGGLIPEIHKPQVWVERTDVERAGGALDEYERRLLQRRRAGEGEAGSGPPIEVECEECGGLASFPAAQRGSVQECPQCGAYIDVGGEELSDDWKSSQPEDDAPEER